MSTCRIFQTLINKEIFKKKQVMIVDLDPMSKKKNIQSESKNLTIFLLNN